MLIKNVPESVIRHFVQSDELCNDLSISVTCDQSPDGLLYSILLKDSNRDLCFKTKAFSQYDPYFRTILLDFHCLLADTILKNQSL